MSFTYNGNIGTDPRDGVRFALGDTNPKDFYLMDGEIDGLLLKYDFSVDDAAIEGCQAIWARLCRQCDEHVGSVSKRLSQRVKAYTDLLAMLQDRVAYSSFSPFAGGISASDKLIRESDPDRVTPVFTKDMLEADDLTDDPTSTDAAGGDSGGD